MSYTKCTETNKNKLITTSENRRKLIICNKNERIVSKIKVDGCLVTNSSPRCDYMFEIDKPVSKVIYLELKGCDVKKAVKQLKATISKFKKRHCAVGREACIVASRVPRAGPKAQQFKIILLREFKTKLTIHTTQASLTI